MFSDCSSMIKAPALPATKLAGACYWAMLCNCTALRNIPKLPEAEPAEDCYDCMTYGCRKFPSLRGISAWFSRNPYEAYLIPPDEDEEW